MEVETVFLVQNVAISGVANDRTTAVTMMDDIIAEIPLALGQDR